MRSSTVRLILIPVRRTPDAKCYFNPTVYSAGLFICLFSYLFYYAYTHARSNSVKRQWNTAKRITGPAAARRSKLQTRSTTTACFFECLKKTTHNIRRRERRDTRSLIIICVTSNYSELNASCAAKQANETKPAVVQFRSLRDEFKCNFNATDCDRRAVEYARIESSLFSKCSFYAQETNRIIELLSFRLSKRNFFA